MVPEHEGFLFIRLSDRIDEIIGLQRVHVIKEDGVEMPRWGVASDFATSWEQDTLPGSWSSPRR